MHLTASPQQWFPFNAAMSLHALKTIFALFNPVTTGEFGCERNGNNNLNSFVSGHASHIRSASCTGCSTMHVHELVWEQTWWWQFSFQLNRWTGNTSASLVGSLDCNIGCTPPVILPFLLTIGIFHCCSHLIMTQFVGWKDRPGRLNPLFGC